MIHGSISCCLLSLVLLLSLNKVVLGGLLGVGNRDTPFLDRLVESYAFRPYGVFYVSVRSQPQVLTISINNSTDDIGEGDKARAFYLPSSTLGSDNEIILMQTGSNSGYCNPVACIGDGAKDFGVVGNELSDGFQLTLGASDWNDLVTVSCPFGFLTPELTQLYCTDESQTSILDEVTFTTFGPVITHLQDVSCPSEFGDDVAIIAVVVCSGSAEEIDSISQALQFPNTRERLSLGYQDRPVLKRRILMTMQDTQDSITLNEEKEETTTPVAMVAYVDGILYDFEPIATGQPEGGWCTNAVCTAPVSTYVRGPVDNVAVVSSNNNFSNIQMSCYDAGQSPSVTLVNCEAGDGIVDPVIYGPVVYDFGITCSSPTVTVRIEC